MFLFSWYKIIDLSMPRYFAYDFTTNQTNNNLRDIFIIFLLHNPKN